MGVGVVGCGGAASELARAINALPDVFVAAAYDRVRPHAAQLVDQFGGSVSDSLDTLLADPAVDIVYIGLPHNLLASTAELALTARRHVLVEKPMALDTDTVRALRQLARAQDRVLGVVFELREVAAFREARRLVTAGAIGTVRAVRITTVIDKPSGYWQSGPQGTVADSWRASSARAGGGVVLMNSIHQLDLVRYLTGLSFVRATAEVATLVAPVEVEDAAAAALRLSNGAVVSLVASAHSPGAAGEERIAIDGTGGRLDLPHPFGPEPLRLFLREAWRRLPAGEWVDLMVPPVDSHVELLRGFVDAVRSGAGPPAGADDAEAALATVLAIYRSARTGQAVDIG